MQMICNFLGMTSRFSKFASEFHTCFTFISCNRIPASQILDKTKIARVDLIQAVEEPTIKKTKEINCSFSFVYL